MWIRMYKAVIQLGNVSRFGLVGERFWTIANFCAKRLSVHEWRKLDVLPCSASEIYRFLQRDMRGGHMLKFSSLGLLTHPFSWVPKKAEKRGSITRFLKELVYELSGTGVWVKVASYIETPSNHPKKFPPIPSNHPTAKKFGPVGRNFHPTIQLPKNSDQLVGNSIQPSNL